MLSALFQNRQYRQTKVFCIGANKTGTTSVESALQRLGFKLGVQSDAELLYRSYAERNFKPIVDYCKTADAFQDVPFSLPFTYVVLDQFFPNAKFILTIRDSAEQWYNSLTRFHAQTFGRDGIVPTKTDLMEALYRHKGYAWEVHRTMFNVPDNDIYNADILKKYYNNHNDSIRDYFRFKNNFLEINLSQQDAYPRFCEFLGRDPVDTGFSWLNKSEM